MDHKPAHWVIVNESPLIMTAMCTCGDDNCMYSATAYEAVNTNLNPTGMVRI